MHFIPNQAVNTLSLAETLHQVVSVFVHTLYKVGGDTCIEGAIAFATEHVNTKLLQRLSWIPAFAGMTHHCKSKLTLVNWKVVSRKHSRFAIPPQESISNVH